MTSAVPRPHNPEDNSTFESRIHNLIKATGTDSTFDLFPYMAADAPGCFKINPGGDPVFIIFFQTLGRRQGTHADIRRYSNTDLDCLRTIDNLNEARLIRKLREWGVIHSEIAPEPEL
jgi:hypothetical protein